jgi:anti-anti-sigma regulatory factor
MRDSSDGDIIFLTLPGRITDNLDDMALFNSKIHEFLILNGRKFVVDLAEIEWLNNLGMGILVKGFISVTEEHGRLLLADTAGHSLLTICGAP